MREDLSSTGGSYYRGILAAKSVVESRVEVHLQVMIFNHRLSVTDGPQGFYYEDAYCYHSYEDAWEAFQTWTGEEEDPGLWAKHPRSGRTGPGFRGQNKPDLKKVILG